MRPELATAAVLAIFGGAGCSSIVIGPPPPPPLHDASPAERCADKKTVTLSASHGDQSLMADTWSDGHFTYVKGRSVGVSGFTFYRGQERLDNEAGLDELGDADLRASYEREREAVSGAKTRTRIARPLWITLMTAGVVGTIAGTVVLVNHANRDGGAGGVDSGGLALTAGGLGAMLVAIPFMWIDYKAGRDSAIYDLRSAIYVPTSADARRLDGILRAQRSRAERTCGVDSTKGQYR